MACLVPFVQCLFCSIVGCLIVSLGRMTSLKDPYPLPPEEQKRLSEVKFDLLENEVKAANTGYNIRPWPWFIGVFGIALFSKIIEWSVSGFAKIN